VPPSATASTVSGVVYEADALGRRPLAGATVEITSSTAVWDYPDHPITDAAGRYTFASVPLGHYMGRATKSGYITSAVVNLGFVAGSRTLDFELSTPEAMAAPPSVAAVSPGTGSTGGDTTVKITGAGFRAGATVAFGDQQRTAYAENSTTLHSTTPAHGAGAVDVVVTNPGGLSGRLAAGYTYAPPQSFDFNGTWVGYALAHPEFAAARFAVRHEDMEVRFTIQNNVLVSISCAIRRQRRVLLRGNRRLIERQNRVGRRRRRHHQHRSLPVHPLVRRKTVDARKGSR
jgi:hypothetical protein